MKAERISTIAISGLYKTLKWRSENEAFLLKVPNIPETSDLSAYLLKRRQPMAVYFGAGKAPIAWQWSLPLKTFRKLWVLESPRVEG